MFLKILKTAWKAREVAYIAAIVLLLWRPFSGPDGSSVDQPDTVVVTDPAVAERVVSIAKKASKPKGLGEKLGTREVKPDRVVVSGVPDDVPAQIGDSVPPTKLPGAQPDWGVAEINVDGRSLSVSSLNHSTGEAQQAQYTLARKHPKLTVRSGDVPSTVREGRNFFGPLRLGLRATGFGGVDLNTSSPAVGAILEGPVGAQLGLGTLKPSAMVGFGGGIRVGGTYSVEIGDL